MSEKMREEFEAAMVKLNPCVRLYRHTAGIDGGSYRTITVERAWKQWQAATEAAARRAVEICEDHFETTLDSQYREGLNDGARRCTRDISREFGLEPKP